MSHPIPTADNEDIKYPEDISLSEAIEEVYPYDSIAQESEDAILNSRNEDRETQAD